MILRSWKPALRGHLAAGGSVVFVCNDTPSAVVLNDRTIAAVYGVTIRVLRFAHAGIIVATNNYSIFEQLSVTCGYRKEPETRHANDRWPELRGQRYYPLRFLFEPIKYGNANRMASDLKAICDIRDKAEAELSAAACPPRVLELQPEDRRRLRP